MLVDGLFLWLNFAGIFVFALSGGLTAARKELDPFGGLILGAVTGMGGGTLRDLLLGAAPVYWVRAPEYLAVALAGAAVGYFASALMLGSRRTILIWADAVGLGVFAVLGAQAGLDAGAGPAIAALMGVMSAAFGGLVRDIVVNEVPLVLREEIYALAAFVGAVAYLSALALGVDVRIAAVGATLIGFGVRACAIVFGWSLPPISPRRGDGDER